MQDHFRRPPYEGDHTRPFSSGYYPESYRAEYENWRMGGGGPHPVFDPDIWRLQMFPSLYDSRSSYARSKRTACPPASTHGASSEINSLIKEEIAITGIRDPAKILMPHLEKPTFKNDTYWPYSPGPLASFPRRLEEYNEYTKAKNMAFAAFADHIAGFVDAYNNDEEVLRRLEPVSSTDRKKIDDYRDSNFRERNYRYYMGSVVSKENKSRWVCPPENSLPYLPKQGFRDNIDLDARDRYRIPIGCRWDESWSDDIFPDSLMHVVCFGMARELGLSVDQALAFTLNRKNWYSLMVGNQANFFLHSDYPEQARRRLANEDTPLVERFEELFWLMDYSYSRDSTADIKSYIELFENKDILHTLQLYLEGCVTYVRLWSDYSWIVDAIKSSQPFSELTFTSEALDYARAPVQAPPEKSIWGKPYYYLEASRVPLVFLMLDAQTLLPDSLRIFTIWEREHKTFRRNRRFGVLDIAANDWGVVINGIGFEKPYIYKPAPEVQLNAYGEPASPHMYAMPSRYQQALEETPEMAYRAQIENHIAKLKDHRPTAYYTTPREPSRHWF